MADATQTFKILLQVVSQLGGLQQLTTGVQNTVRQFETINTQLAGLARNANAILGAVGIGLSVRALDEYEKKAIEVREQQAAFNRLILAGKEGSQEFVDSLTRFNVELERTTGTSAASSRSIEQLFSRAGATQEQIKGLTRGVIEYSASSAGTIQPTELAAVVAKRFGANSEEAGFNLRRLGIAAKDIPGIMSEMQTRGAGAAEAMVQASGGLKVFQLEAEHAEIGIGNLVSLLKIPFLTALLPQLESATQGMKGIASESSIAGHEFDTFGGKLAALGALAGTSISQISNVIRSFIDVDKALISFVGEFVIAVVSLVVTGVSKMVEGALGSLSALWQGASNLLNNIPGMSAVAGAVGSVAAGFDKAKASVASLADTVQGGLGKAVTFANDSVNNALDDLNKKSDEMSKGGKVFSAEYWDQLRAKVRALTGDVSQFAQGVKQGSGVAPPVAEDDKKGAEKAATEALTAAKFQLTEAEQSYKTALEETKLLEDSGLISHEEATRRNIQATNDYIAQLERIRSELPGLISQFEAMGNVKGIAELKTELGQVTNKILEAKIALQGQTFFGKISTQLRQLTNEWSDMGKQIGGFLTQQFQNFASGASQAITGLIFRTGNWKQAILQLGQSFVQALLQMVIQWVLARTVMAALNKAFGAADQAATAAQAAAAAAAWGPAGTAASIATQGIAAGTGLTAYLAAIAAGTAGTVATSAGGGLAEGGRVPGAASHVDNVMLPMASGEAVISSRNVQKFDAQLGRGFVDSLIVGKLPGFAGGGRISDSAPLQQFLSGFSSGDQKIGVHVYFDPDEVRRRVLNDTGKKIVVDAVRGRRLEIG